MIRVNLLAADRPASGGKKASKSSSSSSPSAPGAVQLYLFLAVFVGGAVVLCVLAYFYITREIANLDTDITSKKKRLAELQAVKKQVDEFQAKKKTLEDKVNLIERLRAEQAGPVHMLDEISKALPDFVWLTDMDQNASNVILKGQTSGMNAVADFFAALQRSGWFPNVELRTNVEQNNLVTFELAATFKDPSIAAREAEQKAAAAAAAAAAPKPVTPAKK
jgi:type IV pilus assembly protein PilN